MLLKENIINKIYYIRGQKVMLDRDLAALYGVETKVFNQSVQRNKERFPKDFMFRLSAIEFVNLRSQIVTSSHGGRRYPPLAFTEHGVAMLSGVLKSKRAVQINIRIIRAFIQMREMLATHAHLRKKIEAMEGKYDKKFAVIFTALKEMMSEDIIEPKKIGFAHREQKRKKKK